MGKRRRGSENDDDGTERNGLASASVAALSICKTEVRFPGYVREGEMKDEKKIVD